MLRRKQEYRYQATKPTADNDVWTLCLGITRFKWARSHSNLYICQPRKNISVLSFSRKSHKKGPCIYVDTHWWIDKTTTPYGLFLSHQNFKKYPRWSRVCLQRSPLQRLSEWLQTTIWTYLDYNGIRHVFNSHNRPTTYFNLCSRLHWLREELLPLTAQSSALTSSAQLVPLCVQLR